MHVRTAVFALTLTFAAAAGSTAHADIPGPQGPPDAKGRQAWLVPSQQPGVLMRATLQRPAGEGPYPLAVINHGGTESAELRATFRLPLFAAASEFFLARGYAVLVPLRPGYGETGGAYLEANSRTRACRDADYRRSGAATADSIAAAVDFMVRQTFVKRGGTIVVGQSAGGWGALALASRNPKTVKAVIAFAPGRGGRINGRPNHNCQPERLAEAAASFGRSARVPALAIYTENDSFFGPSLSRQIVNAYRAGGGRLDDVLLPAFGVDGHALFAARDGVAIWGPVVEAFLKSVR
jgi:dienelactone hydrolase